MIPGHVVAAVMARESTRRRLSTRREVAPRRPRRYAAHVLQAAAHRLDPCVAPPRIQRVV